mmetsp:Transcript_54648/g.137977  ORF Transcript_54648/g.137977 Transcript_54648/m.137977 type:complete len:464 (-) Transcript_54648:109-1500(-)
MSLAGSFGLGGEAQRLQGLVNQAVAAPPAAQAAVAQTPHMNKQYPPMQLLPTAVSSLEAWELALEAWVDLRAQGYVIEERRVQQLLPSIAARVPKPTQDHEALGLPDYNQLFKLPPGGGQPVFLALLRPHRGLVHFLYFWKAFGEAAHMAGTCLNDGLTAELEILRDRLLRRVEEETLRRQSSGYRGGGGSSSSSSSSIAQASPAFGGGDERLLPTWAVVEEVHRAASMSAYPRFWQRASESLTGQLKLKELNLEELTSVLLSWLHDTQVWEQQQKFEAQELLRRSSSTFSEASASSTSREDRGLLVRLHIYDVSQEEGIQKLNRILAHKNAPLKFGGVFHAGVEVNGLEWSYGYSPSESRPGVSCVEPQSHPQHHYRQTVELKRTNLPAESIADVISQLIEEYPGTDYNLLRRNCCHFADEFCKRLGVGGIPGWVHRLARLGAGLETMINNAPRPIKERIIG